MSSDWRTKSEQATAREQVEQTENEEKKHWRYVAYEILRLRMEDTGSRTFRNL